MEPELEKLKGKVVDLVSKINSESWVGAQIKFNFPPFINKGYTGTFLFKDAENKTLPIFLPFDPDLQNQILNLIFKYNQENHFNTIVVDIVRDDYENTSINVSFDQEVQDSFEKNIPKSYKGNMVPWWKNPEETKEFY
jgi:hypothetical protein